MPRVLAALPIFLALAACGQPQGAQNAAYAADEKTNATIPSAVVSAPTQPTPAADFVTKAAAGNAFELAAAQAAQGRAQDQGVKGFAAMMLRDHGLSADKLKKALAESGQSLPASGPMSPGQQQGLADLAKLTGPAFDKAYLQGQVQAHQDALTLFQEYAQNGDNPALKAFAAEAVAVIQAHSAVAKQLLGQLK
jgi:putative membrane protein